MFFEDLYEQLVVRQALHDRREMIKTQISAHKALGDLRSGNTKEVLKEYEAQLATCNWILNRVGEL